MRCNLVTACADLVEFDFTGSSLLISLIGVVDAEWTIFNPAGDINEFVTLFIVDAMHSKWLILAPIELLVEFFANFLQIAQWVMQTILELVE